jgi:hypothetical protein
MDPVRFGPVSDCTVNYRPVLSSERAPNYNNQAIVRQKNRKGNIWTWAPKECPIPRQTGRLNAGRNIKDDGTLNQKSLCWRGTAVRGLLRLSYCELSPLEAGEAGDNSGTPTRRATSAVGNRYQATAVNTWLWTLASVYAIVNCKVWWHAESKCPINLSLVTPHMW